MCRRPNNGNRVRKIEENKRVTLEPERANQLFQTYRDQRRG